MMYPQMEMVSATQENAVSSNRACCWFKALGEKLRSKVNDVASTAKKLAEEDPRRIIHSLKVGLAIFLVSLFYYFDPLYEGFGVTAMWGVITVVVVFEYSVGTTLGKGLNRGISTLVAGALGVGAHRIASFSGEKLEPIVLGFFVFLISAIVTFMRFFPKLKARYDYGLLIFILTFCMICVSGYRDDEVLDMAERRLSTILIGGVTAVAICILICPVWAGADLHNAVATNIEKLASFLEGFGDEYSKTKGDGDDKDNKALMEGYKSVLNSKSTEETLANFAKWEPRHGRFRYRHPWNQYLKIGALARECANRIDALNSYLNSEMQTSGESQTKVQELCILLSLECSNALKELAFTIKTWTIPTHVVLHIANAKSASKSLKSLLKSGLWQDANILEIIPAATVASLLLDVFTCTLKMAESVNELATLAKFKLIDDASVPRVKILKRKETRPCVDGPHHVINVE